MQTITHRVRTFLASEGVAIEPWTGLGETYGELYNLLQQRRDDPSFWPPLEALLRAVIEHATDPNTTVRLAAPEAELLTSQDVDELVQALREALPKTQATAASLPLRAFTQQLSPAVLAGFLLLGFVAAGCSDYHAENAPAAGGTAGNGVAASGGGTETGGTFPTDGGAGPTSEGAEGTGGGGPTSGGTDGTGNCDMPDAPTVQAAINNPDLTSAGDMLCNCLKAVDQSWTDGLTALFENASDTEIAAQLQRMVECCRYAYAHRNTHTVGSDIPYCYPEPEPDPFPPTPVYKGVSF